MAIRKNECLDCEYVFPRKGHSCCPKCRSTNVGAYSIADPEPEFDITEELDPWELKDFYDRKREAES